MKRMAVGRPSIFTTELGTKICERIAEGESLRSICAEDEMPVISTVMKWLLEADKKQFSERYEIACNARAELMFEELLEIADDGSNDYMERESRFRPLPKLTDHKLAQKHSMERDRESRTFR